MLLVRLVSGCYVMMDMQGDWMCVSARCNSNRRSLSRDDFEISLTHNCGG